MQPKALLKKLPSFTTIVFTCIVGFCLTISTVSVIFAWVTAGKVLEGRNPAIQIAFALVYFVVVTSLILIVFRRYIDYLLAHPYSLFCLLALAPLTAHAYIGSFSRFVADDFSSAALTVNKGIWGATLDWYINWSGRFSASFFDSLAGYLGPSSMKYAVGLSLLFLLIGMVSLANQILVGASRQKIYTGVFLSSLIMTAAFFITPDLPQSLYWGQGMRSLILPLIPLFFMLTIVFSLKNHTSMKSQYSRWIILGVLSFIAGGFGETYVVIQTTILGLLILAEILRKPFGFRKRLLIPLAIALGCSIAAMVVTILAPGNSVRQTYFPPPPGLFDVFSIAYRSMSTFFIDLVQSPTLVLGLVFLIIAALLSGCLYATRGIVLESHDPVTRSPIAYAPKAIIFVFLTASFLILLYVCFLPSAYGMSTVPPDRTLILPSLVLCIALTVLAFASGLMIGQLPFFKRLTPFLASGWISLLAILVLAGVSFQISAHVLRMAADYRFFAARFDRADQMIRDAKANGETSVTVPEVHNHFGLSDYAEGTTYWLDDAVDSYYGLHVIINKHMK